MGSPIRGLAVIIGALLGVGVLTALAEPLPGKPTSPSLVQPAWGLTGSCEPIDFDRVEIEYYRAGGIYRLTVTGTKAYTNMEVSLSREAYNHKPAYWRSIVVGCVKNFIVVPLETPYYLTVPLAPFVGTKGIEIVGATRRVRRNAPGT
jgi:hypothetical protein